MVAAQEKDMVYMSKEQIRWSSHIPINSSILKVFDITGVLELGIGYHSTPMFFREAKKVIGVETDKNWIDKLSSEIEQDETHQLIHHPMPSHVSRATRRNRLTEQELLDARKFMLKFVADDLNFLFIDCISSLRWEALTHLHSHFDVITFHDYQPPGIHNHYCDGKLELSDDYEMFIDKTYPSHTGILIHKNLMDRFDKLVSVHKQEVKNFHNEIPMLVKYENEYN